jgi:hypothetical protein
MKAFAKALGRRERKVLLSLKSPVLIQSFLDELAYSTDDVYKSPLRVLEDRKAQCFDGGVFAAMALSRLGHRPMIIDLIPNERDDDHILALYKIAGSWGAVAKSNFVGLRFREPVYRTLRELVMSYFELYFNLAGEKTLRAYTLPLSLSTFDKHEWMTRDAVLEQIASRLDEIHRIPVVTDRMARRLSSVDKRSQRAGLLGSVKSGLYRPPPRGSKC